MTVEDLVKLVDEYTGLWEKHGKQEEDRVTRLWHPRYSAEERTAFIRRILEIEKEIEASGFMIGRDESWQVCLYLNTASPLSFRQT
jgi:hypothetical protein